MMMAARLLIFMRLAYASYFCDTAPSGSASSGTLSLWLSWKDFLESTSLPEMPTAVTPSAPNASALSR